MNIFKNMRALLMAAGYDLIMNGTERRCLSAWRRELMMTAHGELLEIGAGTGINLAYYPTGTTRLTLSEPDPYMRRKLRKKIDLHPGSARIASWCAESIDLPDSSCDTIVSTLVLCSVACLDSSLREVYRLLKPGGRLLFIEHVLSDNPRTQRLQFRLEPAWSLCAGDCHLTRDTGRAIIAAGLMIDQLTETAMTGTPAFVSRTIRGIARKPQPENG